MNRVEVLRLDRNGSLWSSFIDGFPAPGISYQNEYAPGKDGWKLVQIIGLVPYAIQQGVVLYYYTREIEE